MGSLKEISAARMLSISEAWLDPARDRSRFQMLTSGKGLLELIQSAHDGLLTTQKKDDPTSREVATISAKQSRLDKLHDRKIRALYYILNGLAEASDDPNEVMDLVAARDELLPKGLSATKDSYMEEAGHVEIAAKRVSAASKGLLKKIALPRGVTLWTLVEQWFAAGRELGTLEQQKDRLEANPTGTAAEALRARNTWIRVVRHVESTLELEGVPASITSAILQQVRLAEQETEKRAADEAAEASPFSRTSETKIP
jgi:hypothetical protein